MKISILSLFPSFFSSPLEISILAIAQEKGLLSVDCVDIRSYSKDKHRRVDDTPFGGGPGMLMQAPPLLAAIRDTRTPKSHVIYLSPSGTPLKQNRVKELGTLPHLVLLAGHYEGIDQRVIDLEVDEEISIGDYILSSGMAAALVLLDAVTRTLPGVLGDPTSIESESFSEELLLEYPQYTKPALVEGVAVPEILLSGHHKKISEWRDQQARERTKIRRPDLYKET